MKNKKRLDSFSPAHKRFLYLPFTHRGACLLLAIALQSVGAWASVAAQTPVHKPPEAISNEANAEQLADARRQGKAYEDAVRWEREGASWAADVRAGDMHLTAALSAGEGGWELSGRELVWHDPPSGSVHLRIFAADNGDGRFIPGATVHARFLDAAGKPLAEEILPAGIYPLTDAYGKDVVLPAGARRLMIVVDPLPWRRHDPYNGDRFSDPTVALFSLERLPKIAGQAASARAEHAPQALRAAMNQALDATIHAMSKQANAGAATQAGDYLIGYAVEYAEAYWKFADRGGKRTFRYAVENENSSRYNTHVEVLPRDRLTGNFLPGLNVRAEVIGPHGPVAPPIDDHGTGAPAAAGNVPLMWHSWLYHYGQNWRVPSAGVYRLRVHVDPPTAIRYGKDSGKRMASPVDVTFENAHIKTGQK